MADNHFDVIVIRGGLGGSAASAILAEHGHRVLVLEREKFPRYTFYDPAFSFKKVIDKYPDAAGEITDCLSGDVNEDFTPLWKRIRAFVPLPENLPVGEPLADATPSPSTGVAG
jgi:choline dehydrogenase-like flavoprotein